MPARDGVFAVSTRPARNVKQPTTPITPAITPTSAERTGTARVPRPGSTASREPISRAGGSPARNVHSPTGLGVAASALPRATRHCAVAIAMPSTTSASASTPSPSTAQSAWVPTSRSMRRASPIGNRGRQGEGDDERGAGSDDGRQRGGQHQRAGGHAAIGAHRPPRREVGGTGGDRAHEGLTGQHDATEDDREREQQQPVALDAGDALDLGQPEQLGAAHDVDRMAHRRDRPSLGTHRSALHRVGAPRTCSRCRRDDLRTWRRTRWTASSRSGCRSTSRSRPRAAGRGSPRRRRG